MSPVVCCLSTLPSLAQPITSDGSTPTDISQTGQQIDISGGTIAGHNQFHSFDQFNVPPEHTANFQAPAPIENVLGRVTGGSPSAIDGTVRVSGSDANLYLMNPAGVIFGEDARLDVPGSFSATSANGIGFEGGGEFRAGEQNNYQDLATRPNSFNFEGTNGDVVNHGNLAVPEGKNLNLVGGTVENTGSLSAPGGGVNVIAVPGSDRVRIQQSGMVLELEVAGDGQGLRATDLPERLTGGTGQGKQILAVGADGRVRLTQHPRGTATVRGTAEQPAQIEADRIQVKGAAVVIENARLDSLGVVNQVILNSTEETTAIVQSQVHLSNLVGIGGLLKIAGRSVQVEQSQVNLRGTQQGQIEIEARSGNTQVSQSRITIATPTSQTQTVLQSSPTQAGVSHAQDWVLAGQLDILSPGQIVIASSQLDAYGIRIGGDFQGQGELVTAQETIVSADSTIAAGNAWGTPLDTTGLPSNPESPTDPFATAGRVMVWADDKTRFLGYLHNPAGFAEISGKEELDLGDSWDQRIQVSELLLDPTNITIATGTGTYGDQTISNFLQNTGNLIITTAGAGTQAGDITVNGGVAINWTSGNSLTLEADRNITFSNNSSITSEAGNITLNANQTAPFTTGSFDGITLNGVELTSNSGSITLAGRTGDAGGQNSGIFFSNTNRIQTTSGDIALTGENFSTNQRNDGLYMSGAILITDTGSITITGRGGSGGFSSDGMVIRDNTQITSTGTGAKPIILNGTGGTGVNANRGIALFAGSTIASAEGDIIITGTGNIATGPQQYGVFISNAQINSTGTGANAAKITITGTGGTGTSDNVGIQVTGSSQVNTIDGDVTLTGTGGAASGETNIGIQIQTSLITATGTGTVTLEGTGGTGTQFNHGINIRNVNDTANPPTGVRSSQGAVTITGNGGEGNNSRGVQLGAAAEVLSTNTASVVLTGTTQGDTPGIFTFGAAEIGGDSATTGGDVSFFTDILRLSAGTTLQGLGQLTIAPVTPGVDFTVDFSIAPASFVGVTLGSLNTGTTTISGNTNLNANTTILGGAIDFSGSLTSTNSPITLQAAQNIVLNPGSSLNSGAGNLTLTANAIAMDSASLQGLGTLTLQPNDPATSIGVGDNASGLFNFTATALNNIAPTFSTIDIGRTDGTGSMRVGININPVVAALIQLLGGSDLGGGDNDNLWTVTGVETGTINGVNFRNFSTLLGGGLADTLQGSNGDEDFFITNPDQVQVGNLTFTSLETVDGGGGNDRFTLAGGTLSGSLTGGAGTDTLTVGSIATDFVITGTDSGTVNTITGGFSDIENLTGGTADDRFSFEGGTLSGVIDGGAGTDRLVGSTGDDTFELAATANAGTFSGTSFIHLEAIDGSDGTDTVTDSNNIGATFNLIGTDNAFLESLSNLTFTNVEIVIGSASAVNTIVGTANPETFSLASDNALQVAQIGFSNINTIQGNGGNDLLEGTTGNDRFTLIALDSGTIAGLTFTGIPNLDGLAGNDILTGFDQDTTVTIIALNSGSHSQLSGNFAGIENLVTGTGNDSFTLSGGTLTGAVGGGSIDGNSGTDTFTADNVENLFTFTGLDSGTITGIGSGFSNIENFVGGTLSDRFVLAGGTVSGSIDGNTGTDFFTADNLASDFVLTQLDSGTVTGVGLGFNNIENLIGGTGNDTLTLAGGTLTGAIDGGSGIETLIADNLDSEFILTAENAGTLTGIGQGFSNIENLTGGTGNDRFILSGGTLTGAIDGGSGIETLVADNLDSEFILTAENAGTLTGIGQGFSNIENLTGGTGNDRFILSGGTLTGAIDGSVGTETLIADNLNSVFILTAENAGTLTGIGQGFSNIENLTGGTGNDRFIFTDNGTLTEILDGADGSDTLVASNQGVLIDISGTDNGTYGAQLILWKNIENIIGGTGNDTFLLSATTLTGSLDGGAGTDTIVGDAVPNTFILETTNGGTVTGILGTFSNIENLVGNQETDTFIIANAGNLTGILDGSGNLDTLIGDDSGNLFVLTGLDQGYVSDRISSFVNIENLTGGSGSDTFFVEDQIGLSGLIDGSTGIDYLIANNIANINIEGYVLPELTNLDSFNAPEKGFYDVYVGDGERKVIEVADIDQSQILTYNPTGFGNSTIASATNTGTSEDFTPNADNELPPIDAGEGDTEENILGSERSTSVSGDDTAATGNLDSRSSVAGRNPSVVPDPTATRISAASGISFNPDADNELPPLNASTRDSEDSLLDPNANTSNSDSALPDPNANAGDSDQNAPDPTAAGANGTPGANGTGASGDAAPIASASGITAESPTEGRELPIAVIILGIVAVGGAAVAVVTGVATTALQSTSAAVNNLLSSLQKALSGATGSSVAVTGLVTSQAQQKLAEMNIALEPRVTHQPNLVVRKQGGVSLTQTAIDLADQAAVQALLSEEIMEKVVTLKEFFGLGEEEEEAETPESEASEMEPATEPEEPPAEPDQTEIGRIEAVKAKIAEAAERAGLPPASLEYLYTAAIEKIGEILEEIDIAPDILATAWGKSFELMEYRDLLADAAPDEAVMIPLVNHEVLSEQAPSLELKFKETLVGQFEVVINFGSVLEGVMLAIEDRKIKRIQVGSATATGGIEFSGLALFEVPEKSLDWNQVIELGEGIAIDK